MVLTAEIIAAAPEVDLASLHEAVERQRKSSYSALQPVLADPRCGRFLLSLGNLVERRGWRNEVDSDALALLSQPMPALADKILTRLHRKAIKRGAHFRRLDVGAQHDLRIDLKKLRYAAEFFLPLYAAHAPAKRYVRRLARLQATAAPEAPAPMINTSTISSVGRAALGFASAAISASRAVDIAPHPRAAAHDIKQ